MIGWCITDLISKRIHRGWDSSAGRREVFHRLTKTTRERSRISFPSWFIEAEIRPLVEEKSFLSWRTRPDRQTDRQTDREPETEIWDTPEERRPGTARISFPGGFIEAEIRPLVEEKSLFAWRRQPDRQTDRQRTRDRFETILKRDGRVQRIPKEPAVAAAARGGGEQEGFWLRWWRWKRWRSC
jgi:hypothetical protein